MTQEQNAKKTSWILRHPIIEIVVATILAVASLFPPVSDPKTALIIAVIGILFAVGRWGVSELLKDDRQIQEASISLQFSQINRLATIIDLSHKSEISELRALVDRYSQIVDPEFYEAKDQAIHNALTKLNAIVNQRRTDELSTGAYYDFLLELLSNVKSTETVYAVSTGDSIEWDDSPQEENFFKANQDIARRGGNVIRYFVFPRSDFSKAKQENKKIMAHFQGTSLKGFFVDKDRLIQDDDGLFRAIGNGFLMIDRRIAVVDVFGKQPRGYVTKNKDEIDRYWKAINQLKQMSSNSLIP